MQYSFSELLGLEAFACLFTHQKKKKKKKNFRTTKSHESAGRYEQKIKGRKPSKGRLKKCVAQYRITGLAVQKTAQSP